MKEAWRLFAACRGMDPNLFFPDDGRGAAQAIAVCKRCPARDACLDDALLNGEHHGIRGGMSERGRRQMRRVVRTQRSDAGKRRERPVPGVTTTHVPDEARRREVS